MYVTELKDGRVELDYISAHTGHNVTNSELIFLPLPNSTKEAVSVKLSQGISTERIVNGMYMCKFTAHAIS